MSQIEENEELENNNGSFRLLFVTLSMILLAFFILLNSMSTINDEKVRLAIGSLLGSFGLLPGTESVEQESEVINSEADMLSSGAGFTIFKKIKDIIQEISGGNTESPNQIFASFDEQTGEITIVAADELLFSAAHHAISPRMFNLLSEIGKLCLEFDGFIQVIGHTDQTGSSEGNWRLSLNRASVVARHIASTMNNVPGKVSALGLSHYKPVDVIESVRLDMANRRVEIIVTTGKGRR